MPVDDKKNFVRLDYALLGIMVLMGVIVAALSASGMSERNVQVAQATQPATTPSTTTPTIPSGQDNGPAEATPGGTRPTTPSPEPARPDADAQKAGAQPALPAAPAEKMGAPVK